MSSTVVLSGQACVPRYDVRAALDVVGLGTYTQLPRCIDPELAASETAPPSGFPGTS